VLTVKGSSPRWTVRMTQALHLQYSQLVLLNFNGLSWPHVTAATLRKQA
jgi:hypothetical protein